MAQAITLKSLCIEVDIFLMASVLNVPCPDVLSTRLPGNRAIQCQNVDASGQSSPMLSTGSWEVIDGRSCCWSFDAGSGHDVGGECSLADGPFSLALAGECDHHSLRSNSFCSSFSADGIKPAEEIHSLLPTDFQPTDSMEFDALLDGTESCESTTLVPNSSENDADSTIQAMTLDFLGGGHGNFGDHFLRRAVSSKVMPGTSECGPQLPTLSGFLDEAVPVLSSIFAFACLVNGVTLHSVSR
uniref:Uncharacterized protein n=1 Tax=Noctiluca scintillans TaxID=2966 RepID=A0A7S1ACP9_NOCSC